jgi:hypothetical protein
MNRTLQQVTSELKRELDIRGPFYARQIQAGKLNENRAKCQLADMAAALEVFSVMTEQEYKELRKRYEDQKNQGRVVQTSLWE